jgi:cytochrome c-type biogenesis protein CcmH/NrfG
LLLDRRRIKKWAKWIALILAVVFVLSFLLLGVGYGGGAGFNIFNLFSSNNNTTDTTITQDQRISTLLTTLAQNPKDIATMQQLATIYLENNDPTNAAKYLELVIATDPTQKAVYLRLADVYMNSLSNYSSAVAVLNKLQAIDPENPDVYLQLGLALRSMGNSSAAIMAWQKYLTLAPNGAQAQTIKDAIATLSAAATTTTTSATTSTTAASTSSTASSTATSASTSTTTSTTTTAP